MLFERIFGADTQKKRIYRGAFKPRYSVLDFGCSVGNTTGAFLDFDYLGYDIDSKAIQYAKRKWKNSPTVKFECGNILDGKIKANSLDFVLFAGTGHHINDEEIILIFNELIRILKPNGELWFFDILKPDSQSPLMVRILAKIDRGKYIRTMEQYKRILESLSDIRITESKIIKVVGALVPQEDYGFFRLEKTLEL